MDLKPGFRLGRYILEEPLGKGAQGVVFFARQVNAVDGTPVVVKLGKQAAFDDAQRELFLAEARRAKMLGAHPNVVQVVDVAEHEGVPFFVMEYSDGTSLKEVFEYYQSRGEGLPWEAVYTILKHMSDALHYAHFRRQVGGRAIGMIHRDIKPANTLVTFDGYAKLLDFGISVFRDDEMTGMHLRGTPRYMSPEHVYSDVCPEMDIYSLGVVAWEMVEGKEFREGLSPDMAARANCHDPPPPISNPEAPESLVELIMTCLNEDLSERPTADEFSRWLETVPGYRLSTESVRLLVSKVLGRTARSRETKWSIEVPDALLGASDPEEPATLKRPREAEDEDTVAWERGVDDTTLSRRAEADAPTQLRRRSRSPATVAVAPRVPPTVVIEGGWDGKDSGAAETVALPGPSFERAPTVQVGGRVVSEESRQTIEAPSGSLSSPDEREASGRRARVLLVVVGVLVSSGLAGAVALYLLGGW